MSPNLSSLLKAPAGNAPKPKPLPLGNFPGVVSRYEFLPAPPDKDYSTIIRFHLKPTAWPDTISEDDKLQPMPDGTSKPIALDKRQLRRDFYDNSLYRLDEFLKSCGVEPNGRSYEECIPDAVGKDVMMEVQQYLNQRTSDIGNQVGNLVGVQAGG